MAAETVLALPDEVLCRIVHSAACQRSRDVAYDDLRVPDFCSWQSTLSECCAFGVLQSVSAVCRHWRRVILQSTVLWENLLFTPGLAQFLEAHAEIGVRVRTLSAPMQRYFTDPGFMMDGWPLHPSALVETAVCAVLKCARKTVRLHIMSDRSWDLNTDTWLPVLRGLPDLQSLFLERCVFDLNGAGLAKVLSTQTALTDLQVWHSFEAWQFESDADYDWIRAEAEGQQEARRPAGTWSVTCRHAAVADPTLSCMFCRRRSAMGAGGCDAICEPGGYPFGTAGPLWQRPLQRRRFSTDKCVARRANAIPV